MYRLLDLCCGAGGAAMGYHRAGFSVLGVDIDPQQNYPFEFVQGDAYRYPLDGFDAVHASPPCQAYSTLRAMHPDRQASYSVLLTMLQSRLRNQPLPYVIENVPGARMKQPVTLCGSMFGLCIERGWLRRHRLFECSFPVPQMKCDHPEDVPAVGVYGHGGHSGKHRMLHAAEAREIMEIDWTNRDELAQAIPPAYTEYIGVHLRRHLDNSASTNAA